MRATDSGTPALYDDVPVQVYIMSSMDFPPLFQRAEQEIFVPEYMDTGQFFLIRNISNEETFKVCILICLH